MSNLSPDQWSQLLTRAARDMTFRKHLTDEPQAATKLLKLELDELSLVRLRAALQYLDTLGITLEPDQVVKQEWAMSTTQVQHFFIVTDKKKRVTPKNVAGTVGKKKGAKKKGSKSKGAKKK